MTPLIQRGAIQRPPAPRRRGLARRSVAHPKPLFTHPFQTTRSGSRKGAKLSKALQPPDGAKELKTTPAEVLARVCHWAGRCPQRRAGTGGTQRLAKLCAGPKPLLGSRAWDEPGERAGFWGWVGVASPFPARWPRGWQLLAPWCVFSRVFFAHARGAVQQQRCHHQAHPTPPHLLPSPTARTGVSVLFLWGLASELGASAPLQQRKLWVLSFRCSKRGGTGVLQGGQFGREGQFWRGWVDFWRPV